VPAQVQAYERSSDTNNLADKLNLTRPATENWLQQNNLKPKQRAETLTMADWLKLTKTYKMN